MPVFHSGNACAVSQMADYDLHVFIIPAQDLSRPSGYIGMTGAVEPVSSHLVFLIILVRQAVQIRMLGHGLMEGCIEHTYHRRIRHQFFAGVNADQIRRIM